MTIHEHSSPPEDMREEPAMDIFGGLLTLMENAALLMGGSLVAALLAYGLTWLVPERYESSFLLNPMAELSATVDRSTLTNLREEVLTEVPLLFTRRDVTSEASASSGVPLPWPVKGQVSVRTDRAEGTIEVVVTANSASDAKRLAEALFASAAQHAKPVAQEKTALMERLRLLNQQYDELNKTHERIKAALSTSTQALDTGALAQGQAMMVARLQEADSQRIATLARLTPLGENAIVEAPRLPDQAAGPKRITAAIATGVMSLLLLTGFVLSRQSLRSSPMSPYNEARLTSLKQRLRLTR